MATAKELDRHGNEGCVDLYYRAALVSARALQAAGPAISPDQQSAWQTYHACLAGLIASGQHYGRLDPRGHLVVKNGPTHAIPIAYHGFAWRPTDFTQLLRADLFESQKVANRYTHPGIGLCLVGLRVSPHSEELFFRPRQPFAVTAILRPLDQGACGGVAGVSPPPLNAESVLEFHNPHVESAIDWGVAKVPLAGDLTAAAAAMVKDSPRQYLRAFTAPFENDVKPQLIFIEPYQRGKIPVVFVHGMYSDPITWVDSVNELRAQPDLYREYQFWVFRYPTRYPTGGDVLASAVAFREKLELARQLNDPQHTDAGLDQMVLVGHSLGGLVSKMQIVASHDILWRQVAMRPFDYLRAAPDTRMQLSRSYFFEPLPFVTRVVFIGTPHQGSGTVRRLPAQIGSKLVRFGGGEDEKYRELMDANRDLFKPAIVRSRPMSVDMMEPSSPLLESLRQTPIACGVQLHSIIGTGGLSLQEPGDGVVTVRSARHPGVQSELYVPAKHDKLHRDPASVAELSRILREHAAYRSMADVGSRQARHQLTTSASD